MKYITLDEAFEIWEELKKIIPINDTFGIFCDFLKKFGYTIY